MQWQYYKEQEAMASNNTQVNQQTEQISQMDVDRVCRHCISGECFMREFSYVGT